MARDIGVEGFNTNITYYVRTLSKNSLDKVWYIELRSPILSGKLLPGEIDSEDCNPGYSITQRKKISFFIYTHACLHK